MSVKAKFLLLIFLFIGTGTVATSNFEPNAPELPQGFAIQHLERIEHAKELLGRHFKESVVFEMNGSTKMEDFIFQHIIDNLNEESKGEALALARSVIEESGKYEMDPLFVLAVIERESRFNAKARGLAGEIGLMQIKPKTAQWISEQYNIPWEDDGEVALENPSFNVKIGVAYLDLLRDKFEGESALYISAYNLGPKKLKDIVVEENLVPK